ncbi:MAG: sigma 54-interacting transcriptional regulator [Halioglobus sp.]
MLEQFLKEEDIASLLLDSNGRIKDVSESAMRLLQRSTAEVIGEAWQDVLLPDAHSSAILEGILSSGLRLALPPLLFHPGTGETAGEGTDEGTAQGTANSADIGALFAGAVIPGDGAVSQASVLLQLWSLETGLTASTRIGASAGDTIAVIALDQLRYTDTWGVLQTSRLLAEIRDQLSEIIRGVDRVCFISGSSIALVLDDVSQVGATDMCRALLSHLNRSVPQVSDARLCVGLSTCAKNGEELMTLAAASRASMLAQYEGTQDAIRFAQPQDHQLFLGQLLSIASMLEPSSTLRTENLRANSNPLESFSESPVQAPPLAPIETGIDGYVVDNMEGAVDQALFLARLDVPIGIIGSAGTGKMYIAKIIHEETGAQPELLEAIDCREFRSRTSAMKRVARELKDSEGKTLVFKSPHLMHIEAQQKLARQLSTRTLADVTPRRYLPVRKAIALFPEPLESLVKRGELAPALASAFAAYPIQVPPIRDRKQAVLRWAHKILGQEGALRDRSMKGFTPDAERAMLVYAWPGNISEMRLCIQDALDKTDKDWLTPVDLGLYEGIEPDGLPESPETRAFLTLVEEVDIGEDAYQPTTTESLDVALGEAIHDMLALELVKPLGSWLEDDLVLATLDRYRQDVPKAANFLHTTARNIRRWLPKIESREEERASSSLWQKPRRLLRDWVRETPAPDHSPLTSLHDSLMKHLQRQGGRLSSARRASVMGVSTPTYLKRLRQLEDI